MEARSFEALSIAREAGLHLRLKGSRFWACCPLHGEKTPSLCFFPDGKYHCFGCGAHGDAADLYAALHGVPLAEALRSVKGGNLRPVPRAPTAADLRRKVEAWKSARWSQACIELHAAQAEMARLESTHTAEKLSEQDAYWDAIGRKAVATDILNLLESASPALLLKMCTEDKCQDTKMNSTNTPP